VKQFDLAALPLTSGKANV